MTGSVIPFRITKEDLGKTDISEVLRYMGMSGSLSADAQVIKERLVTLDDTLSLELSPRVLYITLPILRNEDCITYPFLLESKRLNEAIGDADKMVVFAATIGIGLDRCISRFEHISQTDAYIANAWGTERVERVCDIFCDYIDEKYINVTTIRRFSPGYGDLQLTLQKEIDKILSLKNIGISLSDSVMMSPSKSVTAIIGVKER